MFSFPVCYRHCILAQCSVCIQNLKKVYCSDSSVHLFQFLDVVVPFNGISIRNKLKKCFSHDYQSLSTKMFTTYGQTSTIMIKKGEK